MNNIAIRPRDPSRAAIVRPHRYYCQAISIALLLGLLPFTAYAACWEIELHDKNVRTEELWQVGNRASGAATLVGKSGGLAQAIAVERVNSVTAKKEVSAKWPSGSNKTVELDIQLIDGSTITLASEMSLYYITNDKRQSAPITEVIAVHRCLDTSAIAPLSLQTRELTEPAAVVVMENGDVLYGDVTNDQLHWQTAYASVDFKPEEIISIDHDGSGSSGLKLETLSGDLLNGSFIDASLSFLLTTGQLIEIPTSQIVKLEAIEKTDAVRANVGAME